MIFKIFEMYLYTTNQVQTEISVNLSVANGHYLQLGVLCVIPTSLAESLMCLPLCEEHIL